MKDFIYYILRKADDEGIDTGTYVYDTKENESGKILIVDSYYEKELIKLIKETYKDKYNDVVTNGFEYDTDADERWIDWISDGEWDTSDNGFLCMECNNWCKKDQDAYSSYKNYLIGDGWIICEDCMKDNEDYLNIYINELINNPNNANTMLNSNELSDLGFEKINQCSYANGYYGQVDNPEKILDKVKENNPNMEYIFSIVKNYNPFECEFDLYGREIA